MKTIGYSTPPTLPCTPAIAASGIPALPSVAMTLNVERLKMPDALANYCRSTANLNLAAIHRLIVRRLVTGKK